MRYPTLLCCLLVATTLNAQRSGGTENGWEISASFAPDLQKRPFLNGVRLEIDPNEIPSSQRPSFGFDTVSIAGQDRIFNRLQSFGFQSKPSNTNLWYGATVSAHRRIGEGFDVYAGLTYNQAEYTTGEDDDVVQKGVVNTRSNFLYNLETVAQRSYGINVGANYHLFTRARLHPYFGMGVSVRRFQRDRTFRGQAYLGDVVTVLPAPSQPVTTSEDYGSFTFIATAGLLLRLTDAWFVGLELASRPTRGPGLVGLQVRRRL